MAGKLISLLAVLVVLSLPARAGAQGLAQGVIEGQVVNQTPGGGSVAALDVSLITLAEGEKGETRTTKTDSEGKFRFSAVPVEHRYLVGVNYMEVAYYYPVEFAAGETTKFIQIPVCDTTTSDRAIRIVMRHVVLRAEEGFFSVKEVIWLANQGDRIYVGSEASRVEGRQGTLVFTLPAGASDFAVPEGSVEDYLVVDSTKVINTLLFPPGEKQLVYSYRLPRPSSGELVINLHIDYPTDALDVIVMGEGIEVASTRLTPAEPPTEAEAQFIHFRGENLSRNDIVDVRLSSIRGGTNWAFVIIGIVAAGLILGLVTRLVRRRGHIQEGQGEYQ